MAMELIKYHGAGNDFIIVDSRDLDDTIASAKSVDLNKNTDKISYLNSCSRWRCM